MIRTSKGLGLTRRAIAFFGCAHIFSSKRVCDLFLSSLFPFASDFNCLQRCYYSLQLRKLRATVNNARYFLPVNNTKTQSFIRSFTITLSTLSIIAVGVNFISVRVPTETSRKQQAATSRDPPRPYKLQQFIVLVLALIIQNSKLKKHGSTHSSSSSAPYRYKKVFNLLSINIDSHSPRLSCKIHRSAPPWTRHQPHHLSLRRRRVEGRHG